MSYDIHLIDPETRETIKVEPPHHFRGGTYQFGGTKELWLSVTYNYSEHFHKVFGSNGIRTIYGMTGLESIPLLMNAAEQLKDGETKNYWEPSEDNAKRALLNLLELAILAPYGIWDGD